MGLDGGGNTQNKMTNLGLEIDQIIGKNGINKTTTSEVHELLKANGVDINTKNKAIINKFITAQAKYNAVQAGKK